jgi:hypothetical protein
MDIPNPWTASPTTPKDQDEDESRWVLTPEREEALFQAITLGDDLPLFLSDPSEEFLQCMDR